MGLVLTQTAPWPEGLADLVRSITYREGWHFFLTSMDRGQGSVGLTLEIRILCVDTYHPELGATLRIRHLMPVPPAAFDRRSWQRWLFDQILLVERHEAAEFFQIDGNRPYAPNHGPGNDPYIIFDHATDEEARTSYLGVKRPEADPASEK